MATNPHPRPAEPYYLRNFRTLADAVLERDSAVLEEEDRTRLESVFQLPLTARLLLLRLAGRREGWLRRSRLRYPELPDLDEALAELEARQWLDTAPNPHVPLEELVDSLTHAEVVHVLQAAGQPPRGTATACRMRLADLLRDGDLRDTQLGLWGEPGTPAGALSDLDRWVRLRHPGLFRLLELLYFGNRHQDLRQFLLSEMGRLRHETVAVSPHGLFRTRAEALELLEVGERLDNLQTGLETLRRELRGWRKGKRMNPGAARLARDLLREAWSLASPPRLGPPEAGLPPQAGAAQLRRARLRALLIGAALLERLGRPGAAAVWQRMALELGVDGRSRCDAWRRLVVNLKQSGRPESSLLACRHALGEQPGPLLERELRRRLGEPAILRSPAVRRLSALRHPGHWGGRTLLQDELGTPLTVEIWVLLHEEREGWKGLHAENLLLRALVGLAAWRLIFAPVAGAFLHRFQTAPLDWGRPGFLDRRADEWRRLHSRLRQDRHRAGVRERLHSRLGVQNPLVAWNVFTDAVPGGPDSQAELWRRGLDILLEGLPGRCVAELARLILEQPGELGHGWPDLLLWREDETGRVLEWRLVEVKGPGDQLFAAQRLWLDWLQERGLPVEVIHVDAAG
jgi:hypothetical protein